MYTERLTARTLFSVFSVLSVFVVFCTCQSLFHMHKMCLWLKAQGPRGNRCFLRAFSKNISSARHVALGCSMLFFILFDTSTDLDTFSSDADWNQTKPVRDFLVGWTVWPSGRPHSNHSLEPSFAPYTSRLHLAHCTLLFSLYSSRLRLRTLQLCTPF